MGTTTTAILVLSVLALLALAGYLLVRARAPQHLTRIDDRRVTINPFRDLSFREALDVQVLAKRIESEGSSALRRASDGLSTASAAKHAWSGSRYMASFSKAGRTALKNGTATVGRDGAAKRMLPWLRDRKSGRILEQARLAPSRRLAAMGSALLGIAHLVSGEDVNQRLRQVEAKLDFLLAGRAADQMSRLEVAFNRLRLAFDDAPGPLRDYEIRNARLELLALRIIWRGEIAHRLQAITRPGFVNRALFKMFKIDRSRAQTQEVLEACEGSRTLLEVATVLEVTAGTIQGDFNCARPADELTALESVGQLAAQKRELIRGDENRQRMGFLLERAQRAVKASSEFAALPARTAPPELQLPRRGTHD